MSKGTRSASAKNSSILSPVRMRLEAGSMSLRAHSKGLLSMSFVVAILPLTSSQVSALALTRIICRCPSSSRMSPPVRLPSSRSVPSVTVSPSCAATMPMRLVIWSGLGLWKSSSRQWFFRDLSFWQYLSLQMQMMGILDLWMVWMRSVTPPLSPPDMPSTSSMMSTWWRYWLALAPPAAPNISEVLVAISLIMLEVFPLMPAVILLSDLLRASLAFISTTMYPASRETICAALVLPTPGGPDNRRAFFFRSFGLLPPGWFGGSMPLRWVSSHDLSHSAMSLMCPGLPTSSSLRVGLYLSTHS
mmetsp:Transcript_21104/g.35958  ORF Transcript_21104/g.35958 Transcript_21104/m.35958 type:complete len:303 (-) Transcript_21104:85-993(-)